MPRSTPSAPACRFSRRLTVDHCESYHPRVETVLGRPPTRDSRVTARPRYATTATRNPDVTGYTYEGLALGPDGKPHARSKNAAWQKQILGYLMSGTAVILVRGKVTGVSPASKRQIERWPVLASIDGCTVFARPANP